MKKTYAYLSAALVMVASLSSCSRSDYAFKPAVSPYHVTAVAPTTAAATAETPSATAGSTFSDTPTSVLRVPRAAQPVAVAKAKAEKPDAIVRLAKPIVKASKLQKMVAAKVIKQLRKKQEVTHANQVQSRAGRAALIGLIGLALLFAGAGIGDTFGGIVATIGLIGFIVGVVILIIALINGE